MAWWCKPTKFLSALLGFCVVKPPSSGLATQSSCNAEYWGFLCYEAKHKVYIINKLASEIRSIQWLLMPWLFASPGHHQSSYCYVRCHIPWGRILTNGAFSVTRRDGNFNYISISPKQFTIKSFHWINSADYSGISHQSHMHQWCCKFYWLVASSHRHHVIENVLWWE